MQHTLMASFGHTLKMRRVDCGISQRDLAKKLGWDHSSVSLYESGSRNLSIVRFVDYCSAVGSAPSEVIASALERHRVVNAIPNV